MSKLSEYIGKQFGNPRGIVGRICCFFMNRINKKLYKKTIEELKLTSDDTLLDIGYGNGYLLRNVYTKYKCNMYGIDISSDMKKLAEKKNKKAIKNNKLILEVGDCCNLKYENDMFSAVTSINTIYFWNDTVLGLSEIRRVLKPGMSFYNVVYTKEWLDRTSLSKKGFKKYSKEELESFGLKAGYSSVRFVDVIKNKSFMVIYIK